MYSPLAFSAKITAQLTDVAIFEIFLAVSWKVHNCGYLPILCSLIDKNMDELHQPSPPKPRASPYVQDPRRRLYQTKNRTSGQKSPRKGKHSGKKVKSPSNRTIYKYVVDDEQTPENDHVKVLPLSSFGRVDRHLDPTLKVRSPSNNVECQSEYMANKKHASAKHVDPFCRHCVASKKLKAKQLKEKNATSHVPTPNNNDEKRLHRSKPHQLSLGTLCEMYVTKMKGKFNIFEQQTCHRCNCAKTSSLDHQLLNGDQKIGAKQMVHEVDSSNVAISGVVSKSQRAEFSEKSTSGDETNYAKYQDKPNETALYTSSSLIPVEPEAFRLHNTKMLVQGSEVDEPAQNQPSDENQNKPWALPEIGQDVAAAELANLFTSVENNQALSPEKVKLGTDALHIKSQQQEHFPEQNKCYNDFMARKNSLSSPMVPGVSSKSGSTPECSSQSKFPTKIWHRKAASIGKPCTKIHSTDGKSTHQSASLMAGPESLGSGVQSLDCTQPTLARAVDAKSKDLTINHKANHDLPVANNNLVLGDKISPKSTSDCSIDANLTKVNAEGELRFGRYSFNDATGPQGRASIPQEVEATQSTIAYKCQDISGFQEATKIHLPMNDIVSFETGPENCSMETKNCSVPMNNEAIGKSSVSHASDGKLNDVQVKGLQENSKPCAQMPVYPHNVTRQFNVDSVLDSNSNNTCQPTSTNCGARPGMDTKFPSNGVRVTNGAGESMPIELANVDPGMEITLNKNNSEPFEKQVTTLETTNQSCKSKPIGSKLYPFSAEAEKASHCRSYNMLSPLNVKALDHDEKKSPIARKSRLELSKTNSSYSDQLSETMPHLPAGMNRTEHTDPGGSDVATRADKSCHAGTGNDLKNT